MSDPDMIDQERPAHDAPAHDAPARRQADAIHAHQPTDATAATGDSGTNGTIDANRPNDRAPMRWMTIPNAFSVLRLVVCVPLTIWFIVQPGMELAAAISLAVFGATDWIDGVLARGLGQVSRVGEILDPVADRVGIVSIGLTLAIFGYLPWIVIIVIAVCDIVVGAIGLTRMSRVLEGHVSWVGKTRTAVLMVAMPLYLVSYAPQIADEPLRTIAFWMLMVGTALHVVTASSYVYRYLSPVSSQSRTSREQSRHRA